MSIAFEQSETRRNLMRAFAGESQARNRYTFAAGLAKKQNLQVIEQVFLFTADQERAHAKVFYNYLQSLSGQNIPIDGTYPIDLYPTTLEHLRAAQHNEYQEYEQDYASFAKVAMEEGFAEIGKTFELVAAVEKTHGDRFGKFADLLENDGLFRCEAGESWMCLNCGHIIQATLAPATCTLCKHPQGFYVRLGAAPFQC